MIGGDIKEYQILLDPARMKHYGVSLGEVLAVTRNMNRNANGGVLYEYDNEYIIRGVLSTANAEEIGKGVVKIVGDFPVLLENIATGETCRVDYGHETAEHQYDRLDGKVRRDYGRLAEEPAC